MLSSKGSITKDVITSKDISVHKFPTKPELRLLWLKACNLNMQDDVTKVTVFLTNETRITFIMVKGL
ncbi:hypothetical protein QE152_g23462 [Popillia japonica]|uniref:THAP-type domain-containing protein n=1 Tax=Popillia japonica TaxID=7064 RepID=A0AAW1KIC5_POPJA